MMFAVRIPWRQIWPPVPPELRDELALLRYARLTAQVPILYFTIIAVVGTAMLAAASDAPWVVGFGIPIFVTSVGAVRCFWWLRNRHALVCPAEARRRIGKTTLIAASIAGLCSIWCLLSWSFATPSQQSYYPLFMAMGALTTAFCLSAIRKATLLILLLGIAPICMGLILLGNRMDLIAGSIILIATLFLIRMILGQHSQLVDLLLLKHQLRDQAHTDPLTGLLNRRALIAEAEAAFADARACPALMLIDLDGFKAVNDCHGHAAGDELLVLIARRMHDAVGTKGVIARLGGDEFAVLMRHASASELQQLVDRLLLSLVPPFVFGGARITLGASAGTAMAPADGSALEQLFAAADRALYAVKQSRSRSQPERRRKQEAS